MTSIWCRQMKSGISTADRNAQSGGDPDWVAWLAEHGDRLLLYARQRTACEADAEDVLQMALVRLVRAVRSGEFRKGPTEWVPYVISCIRNAAIDLSRSRNRRQSVAHAAAAQQPAVYELTPWLTSSADSEHRRRSVERVLRRMRPDYAEVVVLHVWQGLSFREIADITDENPATVASRYRAALRIFRKQLEDELNPPS